MKRNREREREGGKSNIRENQRSSEMTKTPREKREERERKHGETKQ